MAGTHHSLVGILGKSLSYIHNVCCSTEYASVLGLMSNITLVSIAYAIL